MRALGTILFVLTALFTNAQSTAGITGIRDTSYNVNNELKKNQKNYPFIQLPVTPKPVKVNEKKILSIASGVAGNFYSMFLVPHKRQKLRERLYSSYMAAAGEAVTAVYIMH